MDTKIIWTKKSVIKEASKYRSTTEWLINNHDSYLAAIELGIFVECISHMGIKDDSVIWGIHNSRDLIHFKEKTEVDLYCNF